MKILRAASSTRIGYGRCRREQSSMRFLGLSTCRRAGLSSGLNAAINNVATMYNRLVVSTHFQKFERQIFDQFNNQAYEELKLTFIHDYFSDRFWDLSTVADLGYVATLSPTSWRSAIALPRSCDTNMKKPRRARKCDVLRRFLW